MVLHYGPVRMVSLPLKCGATSGEWPGYAESTGVKERTPKFARMPPSSTFSKDCGCEPFFVIYYLPSF